MIKGTQRTVSSPDLRGRPLYSSCILTAAEDFGKVLWLLASHGSQTAIILETITSSVLVLQKQKSSSVKLKLLEDEANFLLLVKGHGKRQPSPV